MVAVSCKNTDDKNSGEFKALKEKLAARKTNQAMIKVLVNDQDFYSKPLPFNSHIQLLPQLLKLSFIDKKGSRVEMEMISDHWFERNPIEFRLANGNIGESGGDQVIVMIGKLTNKLETQGKAYFLVNGKVEVPELSQQFISIYFEGNMVEPSQASIVENYVPVKGWIVVKSPKFTDPRSAELLKRIIK